MLSLIRISVKRMFYLKESLIYFAHAWKEYFPFRHDKAVFFRGR